ncbi:hypothetical protein UFOVP1193_31 [uncultured Caudovirales phage]|uniref:Uncharacterized protein n=1 Tax=uncultured Caudovirales phage TaxID=2100421 RepID=A0A6J5R5U9_9CAUD|nr:hypothetical protein UFOVP1193_31 [uncultured Caudovirales phage]
MWTTPHHHAADRLPSLAASVLVSGNKPMAELTCCARSGHAHIQL